MIDIPQRSIHMAAIEALWQREQADNRPGRASVQQMSFPFTRAV